MKSVLWLLLGLVIGGIMGWYMRGFGEQVRGTSFAFVDGLADQQMSYLFAKGSWRGGDLANKINTVEIICTPSEGNCNLHQADVISWGWGSGPRLSLYNKSFRITKLDAQSVVAEPNLPDLCIRQTLTFDRVAKAVTFVRTKINREDSCSIVQDEPVTLFLGGPL
jgi:hypothetical protein